MKLPANQTFSPTRLLQDITEWARKVAAAHNSIADSVGYDTVTFRSFGAVGDGVTDDTSAITAAITYAQTYGLAITGENLFYAISSKISIGGSLAISLRDVNFKAITGTWPTGANGSMLYITEPTNFTSTNHSFQNINCNCNEIAKTGFYVYRTQAKASFIDCHTWYFSEYGFWIKGTGDGNNDVRFIGCTAAERLWTADTGDAFYVLADRTACAWYVDYSADVEFINCVGYGSLRSLYIGGGPYNNQFIGCKFWSGQTRTDAASVNVEVANGERCQFIGCRFDDGAVLLKTFNNQFNGCLFIQYNANSMLRLEATTANEDAAGFSLVGCRFGATTPTELTTSGSGSWATNLLATVVGNIQTDGSIVTLNGKEFQSGAVKYANGQYTFGDGSSTELLSLTGGAGSNRFYEIETNGSNRWAWGSDNVAESGSNAGSNFGINAYDDSGAYLSNPLYITRSTGRIRISDSLETSDYLICDTNGNCGLVLKSPGGNFWKVAIDNSGAIVTTDLGTSEP